MIEKLFFFSFLFIACNNGKGIDVTIKNNRSYPIHNVEIYTSEQSNILRFDQIDEQKEVAGFLSMSNAKSDGHYIIKFKTSGVTLDEERKIKIKKSGYYTNGQPIDKNHFIIIEKDTMIWHTQFKKY